MEYQICKKCILDSNVVGISFDEEGVCNFCNDYFGEKKKEAPNYQQREKELIDILKKRSKNSQYDCLCLYSGGKDSSYMLYTLSKKYKLRVLAFTLDNWFIPEETFSNIKKVLAKLNIDSVVFTPSWEVISTLFKIGISLFDKTPVGREMAYLVGHICWPCFVMISLFSTKCAVEKNIPNLVVGTTPGQIRQKEMNLSSPYRDLVDVYKRMILPMLDLLKSAGKLDFVKRLDLSFIEKIKVLKVKLFPFYEFVHYNEQHILEQIGQEFGWVKPKNTDSCSSNCSLNCLGIYLHKKRYKVSPYLIPFARDVREGLISREEALKCINAELDRDTIKLVSQKLGISLD